MSRYPSIIVDAHEDIAHNYLVYGRDFMQPALKKRQQEDNSPEAMRFRGLATTGFQDALLGRVGLIFATIFVNPSWSPFATEKDRYETPQEAYQQGMRQLDYYHYLADHHDRIELVRDKKSLQRVLDSWQPDTELADHKLGLVVLMEGADPIIEPQQTEEWYERGVRIIGTSWSETRYAGGTRRPGPLTPAGFELLEVMAGLNMILDLSHMTDEGFLQAVESYPGSLIASHSNPRHFIESDRMLSDDMIKRLAERGGVIGVVPFNMFIQPGWKPGDGKHLVTIKRIVDMIDYICQLTGSAQHVGIGSDMDGGFGSESMPAPMDTVTDLYMLREALQKRNYADPDIAAILSGNFLGCLMKSLPDG